MTSVGVRAKIKLCAPPAGMAAGVPGVPVSWLVAGSVVWNVKLAGRLRLASGEKAQPVAALVPELISVAKAVAVVPTWTERLEGRTAATNVVGGAVLVGVNDHLRTS